NVELLLPLEDVLYVRAVADGHDLVAQERKVQGARVQVLTRLYQNATGDGLALHVFEARELETHRHRVGRCVLFDKLAALRGLRGRGDDDVERRFRVQVARERAVNSRFDEPARGDGLGLTEGLRVVGQTPLVVVGLPEAFGQSVGRKLLSMRPLLVRAPDVCVGHVAVAVALAIYNLILLLEEKSRAYLLELRPVLGRDRYPGAHR